MIRFAAVAFAGVVAAGCAVQPHSYVAGITTSADASAVAAGVADMVAAKVPPTGGTVMLVPTPAAQSGNPLTPVLANVLRGRGYLVSDKSGDAGHSVRYSAVPIEGAVVVGAAVDGWNMARPYGRVPGGSLAPTGPLSAEAPALEVAP